MRSTLFNLAFTHKIIKLLTSPSYRRFSGRAAAKKTWWLLDGCCQPIGLVQHVAVVCVPMLHAIRLVSAKGVHDVLNQQEKMNDRPSNPYLSTQPISKNANPHGHDVTFVADADQAAAFGFIPEYQITAEQLFF
jgi:hypothetical protein